MPKTKNNNKKKGVIRRPYVDWNTRYKQLKQFTEKYGHCKVPQKKHPQLGSWVMNQRAAYKKGTLSSDQIKLLNSIGFSWVLQKHVSWNEMFRQLEEYKDKNGNCNVSTHDEANLQLGRWVDTQRTAYKKGKLSSKQIESMNGIGFEWNLDEDKWNEMFEQLVQYEKKNGHCRVPVKKYEANPKLANWVHKQRQKYKNGKLLPDRIELLKGIGFEWELQRHVCVGWDERFEQLKGYKKDHGDCNVPARYKVNPSLGQWVNDQRKAYKNGKLSKERIESLQEVGFAGREVSVVGWDERFHQLEAYKEKNGDCNVSTLDEDYKQLGKWVDRQRQAFKKNKLSKVRINRLEGIGFKWVSSRGPRPAREVSDEDSASGGEETGGATSAGDTPSLPPLPPVAETEDDTLDAEFGGDGSAFFMDEDDNTDLPGNNGVGNDGIDGSSFHMDEEDDQQEDDGEEKDDIDSPTNVSQATEQEGGRSSSVESQQDLRQKLDEANAQIASLLQPDIVDLTKEDSTICEDDQKEATGTKSVEAAVYAVYKVKQEKLDEADKKIAAAEEKVTAAEKRAELAEKRASVAEEEKSGYCGICHQVKEDKHAIVACGHSLCFDCYWGLKKLRCPFCNDQIEPVKQMLKRLY